MVNFQVGSISSAPLLELTDNPHADHVDNGLEEEDDETNEEEEEEDDDDEVAVEGTQGKGRGGGREEEEEGFNNEREGERKEVSRGNEMEHETKEVADVLVDSIRASREDDFSPSSSPRHHHVGSSGDQRDLSNESESIYGLAWSQTDAWIFASLNYHGELTITPVPAAEKYRILL